MSRSPAPTGAPSTEGAGILSRPAVSADSTAARPLQDRAIAADLRTTVPDENNAVDSDCATVEGKSSVSILGSAPRPYQVLCVSAGHGFPLIGSSARIVTVGKALQAAGMDFRILHFGPSPAPGGARKSGVYRGIPFEYTCAQRPANTLARWLVYTWALADLTARLCRLRSLRRRCAIYLYVMDGPLCLYIGCLCRLLGLPVVQEMCEWFPARRARFTQWLYRRPIFALATGCLVISKLIEHRARERSAAANPHLLIHRLPSIVDSQRFAAASPRDDADTKPYFLWCGVGYPWDVRFLIRVQALLNRQGYDCKLHIVSANYISWGPEQILKYAAEQGLPPNALVLLGRVDDHTLETCYRSATALLLPLWDDDKSKTRMPNKLAEYLASGRPVVTCKVGDLLDFLVDGVNAYLAEPGSEGDFAGKMMAILEDPETANRVGAAGQQTCLAELDYRTHAGKLAKFFTSCIGRFR